MKWKYIIIAVISLLIIGTLIYLFVPPTFTLKNHEVNIGEKYKEDLKVTRFGIDYTPKTKVISKVKTDKLGSYNITYKVKIGFIEFTKTESVKVVDKQAPDITLNGNEETLVCPNKTYQDEGAKANDNYDGDISSKIKANLKKDEVIYTVKDSSGNKAKKSRKLTYDDKTAPTLTLKGSQHTEIVVGTNYKDPGVSAVDNCDGDISNKIVTSGHVDTSKIGTYTITYSVLDSKNNQATITRTVKVIGRAVANGTGKAGTIYLTFDDGPKQGTTNLILDILKEENVKATFFITGHGPDNLIKREYDEGHTVAIHTFSHNYKTCYSSVEGFFNDIKKAEDRVKNITGYDPKIIRFAGGSSNTVSRKYSKGIMTTLSKEVINRGYQYYDWNVSSGDAGETKTASGVYNNVVKGLSKNKANIILMHDINTYTKDALRNIIRYGKQNGYTFDRITSSTTPYHHHINN